MRVHVQGEVHEFPGVPTGTVGHYVAEVIFPAAGAHRWEVAMAPFASQELGVIEVRESMNVGAGTTSVLDVLRTLLPALTLLGLGLVVASAARAPTLRPVVDAG